MPLHLSIATPKHLRRRALALLGAAVTLGSGAAALPVADAQAQMYTMYQNYQVTKLPDYQVTIDAITTSGWSNVTVANRGAGTTTQSWAAVYDQNNNVTAWLSVPGLAAGESWSTWVAAVAVRFCPDEWQNYIVESLEQNNCREPSSSGGGRGCGGCDG